jgi:hypothetical protein
MTTHMCVTYVRSNICSFKFDIHLENHKKINLGANSVKSYSTRYVTIFILEFVFFYFSKCRSNFELKFDGL